MSRATVDELRADLRGYLERVRAGEDVVVVEGETPVARISPIAVEDEEERLLRLQREGRIRLGSRTVSDAFWEAPPGEDPQGLTSKALVEEREENW